MDTFDNDRQVLVDSLDEQTSGQDVTNNDRTTEPAPIRNVGDDQVIIPSNPSDSHRSQTPMVFTSQFAALLITVNVTIGAGLLAMPERMQHAGLIPSMMILVPFLVMIVITTIICTELTVKTKANSFPAIVKARCHPYVYIFAETSLLLIIFGTLVAYLVIIGDQSDKFFSMIYGKDFKDISIFLTRRSIIALLLFSTIKPLCAARTIDFLKYASFLGVLSIGFIMYVVVAEFFKQNREGPQVKYWSDNWTDSLSVLPVFCLAFQCHISWVPTCATVHWKEKYTTYNTVSMAMTIVGYIYSLVCVLAVMTFGSTIKPDLTDSFMDKNWTVKATIAIVAFKCVFTLPPAFFPARMSMIDILRKKSTWYANLSEFWQRILVTYSALGSAYLLASSVPNILPVVNFLGCFSVMFIFTLPGLSYLHLIDENRVEKQQLAGFGTDVILYSVKDQFKRGLSYFIIVFGIVMTMVVSYQSLVK